MTTENFWGAPHTKPGHQETDAATGDGAVNSKERAPDPVYDFETQHDAEIGPLMDQIIAICRKHQIPMVASFAFKRDADTTQHCSTTLLPGPNGYLPPEFSNSATLIRQGMMTFAIRQLME